MNKKTISILVGLVLVLFVVKKVFFASAEEVIQKKVQALGELVSKEKGQGRMSTVSNILEAVELFSAPIDVSIEYTRENFKRELKIRDTEQVRSTIAGYHFRYPWLDVRFENVRVNVQGDSATAECNLKFQFETKDQGAVFDLFDVELAFIKIESDWYINGFKAIAAITN